MSYECKITTFDNPFDPFEQFEDWRRFDEEKGYDSCSRIARLAEFSDDMTQKEIDEETERAIDTLIEIDFLNIYEKRKRIINDEDE